VVEHPLVNLGIIHRIGGTFVSVVVQLAVTRSPHDSDVRQIAAVSARLAYLFMCLTLAWGVFAATGWLNRITRRGAVRGTHAFFAVFTIAFGLLHAAAFLFLTDANELFDPLMLTVPLAGGSLLRWAPGIIGLELMIAIAIAVNLQHRVNYRKWLRFHQFGYVAVGLTAVHSWFGAVANGHLELLWLAGITVLAPVIVVCVLRFVPSRVLASAGLLNS
jgi:sulfoxide reductase heme-binding subunit YedZ